MINSLKAVPLGLALEQLLVAEMDMLTRLIMDVWLLVQWDNMEKLFITLEVF